jgi:galactose mutarotase-like enzyme
MSIKLENEIIEIVILEKGAELSSMKLKGDNLEYIWSGNAEYWNRHAPILFPIVGKVNNNSYMVDENTYHLSQHGFARDMDFSIVENDKNHAQLSLLWNEDLLRLYPYKFELLVDYRLEGNTLHIGYRVKNCDIQSIYFSIGAHPGFNCPLSDGESFEDYYFEFENNEYASITLLNKDGLLLRDAVPFLKNERIIPINKALFANDALIFKNLKSNKITLKNTKNPHTLTVNFDKFPFLGLWSKPSGAPFVCIEPWFGHADYYDFHGDFKNKEDIIALPCKEEFSCTYSITAD